MTEDPQSKERVTGCSPHYPAASGNSRRFHVHVPGSRSRGRLRDHASAAPRPVRLWLFVAFAVILVAGVVQAVRTSWTADDA